MLARALRLHAAGDADGAIAAYRATLLSGAAHETIAAYSNLGSLLVAEGSCGGLGVGLPAHAWRLGVRTCCSTSQQLKRVRRLRHV